MEFLLGAIVFFWGVVIGVTISRTNKNVEGD